MKKWSVIAGSIGVKFFWKPLKTCFCSSRKKQDVCGNRYSVCVIQTCNRRISNDFALNFVQGKLREKTCCMIICSDYFRMSFENIFAKYNINEKQELSLLMIYFLSNTSSIFFCLTNSVMLIERMMEINKLMTALCSGHYSVPFSPQWMQKLMGITLWCTVMT